MSFIKIFFKKPPFLRFCRPLSGQNAKFEESTKFKQINRRPDLDFDYILDPENVDEIRENIKNRKQIGDIDKLHQIWNRLGLFINNVNELRSVQASRLNNLWDEFYDEALLIPNATSPQSPIGDENEAKIVHTNLQKQNFEFKPRSCEEILSSHQTLRFDISQECGEKSYVLLDKAAILERILIDYTTDYLKTEQNFKPIIVPDILNVETARNCGLSTKSTTHKTLYTLKKSPEFCLSGTAELGVASYFENAILNLSQLPIKMYAVSRCYRPEISSASIQKGLYRVHEFTKVEMFAVTANETGEESDQMLTYFVDVQKQLFSCLNLHFKVLDMASQELGAPAYRKFDVEAWMPGRDSYGEISSASNCTDFQSRRLLTQYKDADGNLKHVHTVNGTACATTRLMIALVEQHQKHNSNVDTPENLKPYADKYLGSKGKNKPLKMKNVPMRTSFE